MLAKYPKAATGEVNHGWGEEGEFDRCFTLEAVSDAERPRLIADLTRVAASNKLVSVTERGRCNAAQSFASPPTSKDRQ